MWNKVRLIFPVIFAGIIAYHIYGHYSRPVRQPLSRTPPLPGAPPEAFAGGETMVEKPEKDDEASTDEELEPEEPSTNRIPIAVLLSSVGLTAGYLVVRRVLASTRRQM